MLKPAQFKKLLLAILLIIVSACTQNNQISLQQLIPVKSDTLQIDNTKDTLVFGSKGTALFFEKGSFQLPDGTAPSGRISIQLKEFYKNSDIIGANLTTTSDGKLLETRGMINVAAFANNKILVLKKGKKIIVHFPKTSSDRKTQMNLFYGNIDTTGTVNWQLDKATILKPTAYMTGWSTEGYPGGDTSRNGGFYFKGQKEDSIFNYFYQHFDNTKLQPVKDDSLDKVYKAEFIVNKQGKITDIKITEEAYDGSGNEIPIKSKIDPYFYKYIQQIPPLEPFYAPDENNEFKPSNSDCSFRFSIGFYPPNYRNNESYNKIFNKKYKAFKNSAISSMNYAELNYYIFSSSKLGWINCDYFWKVNDEKIDYYVKADPKQRPNIKLIFKQAKSILTGTPEGDKYVFKNVPTNQDVKIVAITFDGSKPLMAIAQAKTGKQIFDKLDYKPFSVSDLEKQINVP